jgi:hypothetical protein
VCLFVYNTAQILLIIFNVMYESLIYNASVVLLSEVVL